MEISRGLSAVLSGGLALGLLAGIGMADPIPAPAGAARPPAALPVRHPSPAGARHSPATPIIPPAIVTPPLGPPPLARAPLSLETDLLPVGETPSGKGAAAPPADQPAGS